MAFLYRDPGSVADSPRADCRTSAAAAESLFRATLKDRSFRLKFRINPNLKQNARHEIPLRLAIRGMAT